MTDSQDETLENQTTGPDQPDTPTSPVDAQNLEQPVEEVENEVVEDSAPIPQQFPSPYFPNGIYEDARKPEKEGISYDPFAAQTDAGEDPDNVPKRKVWLIIGGIVLVLITVLVYGLATGRLILPF